LELFISGNSSQNYSPSISKSLELEKNRLKQEKNSFIIKVLVVVILGLLLFK
jgi:ubiquinone biosynthesis protein